MVRKSVFATLSAALCLASLAPGIASAQEHRFAGFDGNRGATATVNLRVPFGPNQARRTSYGLTLGVGRTYAPDVDGRTATRSVTFADLRFSGGEVSQARVAGLDFANLDQTRQRMNLTGEGKKTWLVLGGIVVGGVIICVLADCFDGDEDSIDDGDSPGT